MQEVRRQGRVEYKVLRQIGVRSLLNGSLWRRASWKELLPLQTPRRLSFGRLNLDELEGVSPGCQAVYLPPEIAASVFPGFRDHYPTDAGVKIVREPGDVATSHYVSNPGHSKINRQLTGDHGRLSLVANLLHLSGLGPRLYDLVELDCDGTVRTAYVVRHVDGREPTVDECRKGLSSLRSLDAQGVVKVTLPDGWDHLDFQSPKCNGNALIDLEGRFHYVDFQNFVIMDYQPFLNQTAQKAVDGTHFGATSLLRGGKTLYQSIPGVNLPAQRSVEDRYSVLAKLMNDASLSVKDRLVLDIGCNVGMMMAEYLKAGASWCHGWDLARVTEHTERMLLALGCTRFSLTGCDIDRARKIENDIPRSLDGCVISYLAIRKHVGWLDSLAVIPWSFLIYEGHQQEGPAQMDRDLADFRQMVQFNIVVTGSYKDGVSDERFVAVLQR